MRMMSLILLGLVALVAPAHAAELKIATVDLNRVVNEMKEGKQAQERLRAMAQGKQAEINQLEAQIRSLTEEYQAKAAVMNEAARADLERRIQEAQMNYQQTGMRLQGELQQAEAQVMEGLMAKVRAEAAKLAAERGYSLIIDAAGPTAGGFSPVIYAHGSLDVTDELIARLNAGS